MLVKGVTGHAITDQIVTHVAYGYVCMYCCRPLPSTSEKFWNRWKKCSIKHRAIMNSLIMGPGCITAWCCKGNGLLCIWPNGGDQIDRRPDYSHIMINPDLREQPILPIWYTWNMYIYFLQNNNNRKFQYISWYRSYVPSEWYDYYSHGSWFYKCQHFSPALVGKFGSCHLGNEILFFALILS